MFIPLSARPTRIVLVASLALTTAMGALPAAASVVEAVSEVVPTDPLWPEQWGSSMIDAPAAWALTDGQPITVAVIDSGVDASHPDLAGAVLPGYNVLTGSTDTSDTLGHGTQVAGVIAGRGNNGQGIAGMCWSCQILPVKVMATSFAVSMADVATGIVWATDHGANVINVSIGANHNTEALSAAVRYAQAADVAVVASAGNNGTTETQFPAAYDGVLSVAASDQGDQRYVWSSYGSWVDVAAPGCNLTTQVGGGFVNFCGTSSASPMVAGVVALARAAARDLSASAAIDLVTGTAMPSPWTIAGRVDAGAATAAAAMSVPPTVTTTSVIAGRVSGRAAVVAGSLNVEAGSVTATITRGKASKLTVVLVGAAGQYVVHSLGSPVEGLSVPAGAYEVVVSGPKGPFEVAVSYQTR